MTTTYYIYLIERQITPRPIKFDNKDAKKIEILILKN